MEPPSQQVSGFGRHIHPGAVFGRLIGPRQHSSAARIEVHFFRRINSRFTLALLDYKVKNVRELIAHFPCLGLFFVAVLLLASCRPEPANSLGDAYVAPASLNLRSTLTTKSATVVVLKHGDHLKVIDVKRRYVKVETDKGAEGWLDSRQLLSKEQMDQLRKDSSAELRLPSQGRATTFDVLNVHIEPDRHSAAFAQIPVAGSVEVLAHMAVTRVSTSGRLSIRSFLMPPPAPSRHAK